MSTRGLWGFRKNGVDKFTYNHYDSYPEWLGFNVVEFVKTTSVERMNEIFDDIVMVYENDKPTEEQLKDLADYIRMNKIEDAEGMDWYSMLHGSQGKPTDYDYSHLKYMTDAESFIKDSAFCEYAYVINLDTNAIEFWTGWQRVKQEGNRYGECKVYGAYYPCRLEEEYPFEEVKKSAINDIIAAMLKNLPRD